MGIDHWAVVGHWDLVIFRNLAIIRPVTSPLRIAIAGTRGHWKHTLEDVLARRAQPDRPQAQLVAVADAGDSADGLMKWAAEQGVSVERFGDHAEMLRVAKPDLFVPCAAFEDHASMCLDAIAAGVHVLSEKPAALNDSELSALRAACAARPNVHLAGMMFSRYEPAFLMAAEMIHRGELGRVRLINVRKSYKLGRRGAYFLKRETYGGTIPWVGSHAIDWAQGFARMWPTRVYAAHSTDGNGDNGTMEASASCLLEYPGGLTATASVDVLRPEAAPTHGDDWARVVGTWGTLEVRPGRLDVIDGKGARSIPIVDAGRTLVGELLDAIALGTTPWVDTRATLELTATLLAARRSADEGRVIDLDVTH